MLRKLLACLAFLTGLAAAGAPAQAEVASALATRLEASASAQAPAGGALVAVPNAVARWPDLALTAGCAIASACQFTADTVRLGIDRARE